ncbi:MAG: ComF family protein [Pseudomonadota bacterium]
MPLRLARETLSALLDRMVPPRCGLCGQRTDTAGICSGCRDDLRWIVHACPRCASPLPDGLPEPTLCAACQQRLPPFAEAGAPLHYVFPIDAVIKAFKFNGRIDLATMLGGLLLPWLADRHDQIDAIVPVPLHRWRQARRGYNQADELAAVLARGSGLPVEHRVRRRRATRSQSELSAAERRRNVRGAFRVDVRLDGRRVLVVDDVMTTGATAAELASQLLRAGAASVSVLCVARASPPRSPTPVAP